MYIYFGGIAVTVSLSLCNSFYCNDSEDILSMQRFGIPVRRTKFSFIYYLVERLGLTKEEKNNNEPIIDMLKYHDEIEITFSFLYFFSLRIIALNFHTQHSRGRIG